MYPALELWCRLSADARAALDREDRIQLWRAACWEAAAEQAMTARAASREQACQAWAIGALLLGWSVGQPSGRLTNVTLSANWQLRYVERLRELERQSEAVA